MRRTRKNGIFSLVFKPLCFVLLLVGLFGMVWLRSSVTSAAYTIRELEDKRSAELKQMKTLFAERSRLMALSNIEIPGQGYSRGERKLVSGTYVFPDRVKVIHVKKTKNPEVYKTSFRAGEQR
jgi:hypothetical protein